MDYEISMFVMSSFNQTEKMLVYGKENSKCAMMIPFPIVSFFFPNCFFLKADRREVTIVDYGTALINPWADRITQLGGK